MIYSLSLALILLLGCSPTEPEESMYGCTIQSACNFDSNATTYDASCLWPESSECSCSDVENQIDGCDDYFSYDPATFDYEEEELIDNNESSNEEYDISDCAYIGYSDSECEEIQAQCGSGYELIWFDNNQIEILCCCEP